MQLGGKYQPDIFANESEPNWEINIFTIFNISVIILMLQINIINAGIV